MLKNTSSSIKIMHKILAANSIGLWKNTKVATRVRSEFMPRFFCNTASFPSFEKHIFSTDPGISYHLTGYGVMKNESMIRFLGESAERYSFSCINNIIQSRTVEDSYENLCNKHDSLVLPLEYINIYTGMDINPNTVITWVKMNSFSHNKKYSYIPAAFVIMGWNILKNEKTAKINSVSTGTACHQSITKALKNAIIEYLQLDSANLWWQGGFQGRRVPENLVRKILKKVGLEGRFFDKFRIEVTDISFDKPINIYICEIFAKDKELPQYVVGIQGGIEIEDSIYRGILEGLTILEYAYNYKFINQEVYNQIQMNVTKDFYDLDKNVILYAKYGRCKLNTKKFEQWNDDKLNSDNELFGYVNKTFNYAGFLDITPYDVSSIDFHISRIIIPELIPLYLPSMIPRQHPRFLKYEVLNDEPHPMP